MIETPIKNSIERNRREVQENAPKANEGLGRPPVDYARLAQEEIMATSGVPPADLRQANLRWLRELVRDPRLSGAIKIEFFKLDWKDVPCRIDSKTGENIYEIDGRKKDDSGNRNPEYYLLNRHPLPENATIVVRNPNGTTSIYKTDRLGRVVSVHTEKVRLSGETRSGSVGNDTGRTKDLKNGKPGDEGGHLLGDIFGGIPAQINLAPMSFEANRKGFGNIEKTIAKALKEGRSVTDYKIELIYGDASARPTAFRVSCKIDGKPYTTIIKNQG